MAKLEKKSFSISQQPMVSAKAHVETVELGGIVVARGTYEPGWKWSTDFGPKMGTDTCSMRHFGYLASGKLGIKLRDGSEIEVEAGDVFDIPPGHDAWTIGNEPAVLVDFGGGPGGNKAID